MGGGEGEHEGGGEGDNGEEGNREGETGRRATGRGDGDGGNEEEEMGRGATGRDWREGKEVVRAHGMPGWNEVTVFSDFACPCNTRYPSL